jgi:8-amino-7-oxononanoate synthase
LAASAALEQKGILVTAIRPPTVPPGTSRLRLTFSAAHSEQQVDQLLSALAELKLPPLAAA